MVKLSAAVDECRSALAGLHLLDIELQRRAGRAGRRGGSHASTVDRGFDGAPINR